MSQEIAPHNAYVEAWLLGSDHPPEDNLAEGFARVYLDRPEIVEMTPGYFLMRLSLRPEEVTTAEDDGSVTVYMPAVRSRPHSTLWSNTAHAQAVRKMIEDNPVPWREDE